MMLSYTAASSETAASSDYGIIAIGNPWLDLARVFVAKGKDELDKFNDFKEMKVDQVQSGFFKIKQLFEIPEFNPPCFEDACGHIDPEHIRHTSKYLRKNPEYNKFMKPLRTTFKDARKRVMRNEYVKLTNNLVIVPLVKSCKKEMAECNRLLKDGNYDGLSERFVGHAKEVLAQRILLMDWTYKMFSGSTEESKNNIENLDHNTPSSGSTEELIKLREAVSALFCKQEDRTATAEDSQELLVLCKELYVKDPQYAAMVDKNNEENIAEKQKNEEIARVEELEKVDQISLQLQKKKDEASIRKLLQDGAAEALKCEKDLKSDESDYGSMRDEEEKEP